MHILIQCTTNDIYLQDFPETKSSGDSKRLLMALKNPEKNELTELPIKQLQKEEIMKTMLHHLPWTKK